MLATANMDLTRSPGVSGACRQSAPAAGEIKANRSGPFGGGASADHDKKVKLVDTTRDALYNYSPATQKDVSEKAWASNPNYFRAVRISAVALMKMVIHARSGGSFEVMGLMQGYVDGTTIVVTDAFRLPVEGTETRVNAQEEANEYLVEYLGLCREQAGWRTWWAGTTHTRDTAAG